MNQLERSDLIYNSCYCEENIWKMMEFVETSKKIDLDKFYVVFISNKNKTVPIWCQKKCKSIEEPVIWDYHVIAIEKDTANKKSAVYDMDTVLGFPEPFTSYTKKSLPQLTNIRDIYKRFYKVIPAKYYLEHFASDRSHMIDTKTGEYFVTPPSYQCIKTNESTNNIDEFMSMEHESNKHGVIMNENSFRQFFTAF